MSSKYKNYKEYEATCKLILLALTLAFISVAIHNAVTWLAPSNGVSDFITNSIH